MKRVEPTPLTWPIATAGMLGMAGGIALWLVKRAVRNTVQAQLWRNNPEFAAQTARAMLDYTLPAGFREQKALVFNEMRTVLIASERDANGLRIVLIQEPQSLRHQEWHSAIEAGWTRTIAGRRYKTRLTGIHEQPIGGMLVALHLREGTDDTGQPVRQLTGVIPGKQGEVILAIVAPVESWNQDLVDQFVRSIQAPGMAAAHDMDMAVFHEQERPVQP